VGLALGLRLGSGLGSVVRMRIFRRPKTVCHKLDALSVPAPPQLHHNHFTTPFPGPPGWAGARRKLLLDFYDAREDNKRQTHRLISNPHPSVPPFLHQMPFLPQFAQFILAWDKHRNMLDCIRYGPVF